MTALYRLFYGIGYAVGLVLHAYEIMATAVSDGYQKAVNR